MLGCVAYLIIRHEQINKTEFVILIYFMWSLPPKDLTNQDLFMFDLVVSAFSGSFRCFFFKFLDECQFYSPLQIFER